MKRTAPLLVVLSLVFLAFLWGSYLSFSQNVNQRLYENAALRLQEIMQPNTTSFTMQMEEQVKKVNTFADFLGNSGALGNKEHLELLRAAVKNNGLLRCAIAFPNGSFLTHDGKNEGNVSEEAFFEAAMRGEFFISDPRPAVAEPDKTVMLFAGPIEKNGRVIGVVIYSYLCEDLHSLFNLRILEGKGQLFVAKQSGELLIGPEGYPAGRDNLLQQLRAACTHQQHTGESCLVIGGQQGAFVLSLQGEAQPTYFCYSKLPYNDWYLFSTLPQQAASQFVTGMAGEQRAWVLSIVVSALLFLMAVLTLYFAQRNNIDKMTGTYTLDMFKRKARHLLRRSGSQPYVVVKMDVKNFKLINRAYSYTEGDRVIQNIASALRLVLRGEKNTLISHTGTDDFLLLMPYSKREVLDLQRHLFLTQFRELMGPRFNTTVEFPTGQYVLGPTDFPNPDITEILEKVNFAHRAAKTRPESDNVVDYEETIEKDALLLKLVEDRMAHALETRQFRLYLQPKVCLADGSICGAEALVRWKEDEQYFMHPADFIPILERNGFIVKLDFYMFRQAAQKLRTMLDTGETPVPISVNFSRFHLRDPHFVQTLCDIADEFLVPRRLLEVELTESAVFENVSLITELLDELHYAGFTLSMDDFGSGYSCLALLKDLPVDMLKIDKNFFDPYNDTSRSRVVISNVLRLAQDLHIATVAEGIETLQQVEMLRDMGCDIVQGFYFSRPMPAEEFHPDRKLPGPA